MRVVLFLVIVVLSLTTPYWILLMCAPLYALRYFALELIVLGAFLDALLGGSFAFFYTTACALIVLAIEAVKPFLIFYEERA